MNFGYKNLWLTFFPNGSLPSHTQYGLSFQIFVFSQGRHAAYFKSNSQCLAEHHTLRHLQNFQESQKLILYNVTELTNKCSLCPICIKFFLGHQFKKECFPNSASNAIYFTCTLTLDDCILTVSGCISTLGFLTDIFLRVCLPAVCIITT